MTTPKKLIYGVWNGEVYAASGAALIRAIAAPVIMSCQEYTMGDLRKLVGAELADELVLAPEEDPEEDELTLEEGVLQRPIADEQLLTVDNIFEDHVENVTWIENAMSDELPVRLRQTFGAKITYHGGYGLREADLPGIEELLREEGYQIFRDDDLIALIEDYDLTMARALAAREKIISYVGNDGV